MTAAKRLGLQPAVGARRDEDDRRGGALHEEGILPAAHKRAVPLHQPKVLVNVDTAQLDHGRELASERLPARRKLLARLAPVCVERTRVGMGG